MTFLKRLIGMSMKTADQTGDDPTSREPAMTKSYVKEKFVLQMISLVVGMGYLVYMGVYGGHWLDSLVQPYAGGNRWLELFGVAGLFMAFNELLTFPISLWSGFFVEHRYGLSNQSFAAYMWKWLKMAFLMIVIGGPLLAGLYFILWNFTAMWWLWATVGMLLVSVVFGKFLPVLLVPIFYKVQPLNDEKLETRLKQIAEGTGLTISNISKFGMSRETKKANAFLSGMGSTKHVMLGDTLIWEFTQPEIETVFAHEVGHYVHGHVVKGIIYSTVVTLLSFFVCNMVAVSAAPALGYAAFTAPAALPLFFLILGVFGFLIGPFEKAVSRYHERQSDWYALERLGDVTAHKAAFTRLADLNKAEVSPPRWKVLLFYTHPPIEERLAMADRFAALKK